MSSSPRRDVTVGLFVQALRDLLPAAAADIGLDDDLDDASSSSWPGPPSKRSRFSPFRPAALDAFERERMAKGSRNEFVLRMATTMATVRSGED